MTDKTLISLYAETHIHVGIGQSVGALDLPVARERTTQYPFIPGSGVKGAMRVWANERAGLDDDINMLFGKEGADQGNDGSSGHLLCSDVRLLALPVRAVSDSFKWVTCQDILTRLKKDAKRSGHHFDYTVPSVSNGRYLGAGGNGEILGLEEREFRRADDVTDDVKNAITQLYDDDIFNTARLADKLVIVSNKDFVWFANYGLPILHRNSLDENKHVEKGALWQEESLAPETLMYMTLAQSRNKEAVDKVLGGINVASYIQMGGNETIGQGWFKMKPFNSGGGVENG